MTSGLKQLRKELHLLKNPSKAQILSRFFKTGEGEYGYGDVFIGLTVPQSRKFAIQFKDLPFEEIKELLASKIHEERLIALLILVHNFNNGSDQVRQKIFEYYLKHTQYINNWDLVDLSADKIVGEWIYASIPPERERSSRPGFAEARTINIETLTHLAHSENIWERRIAMIATYAFIKNGVSQPTFQIAEILINDKHDLIQKAVGWMLREVGKRCSQEAEEEFLKKHYKTMPRTALRYAIERFDEKKRKFYLAK